MESYLKDLPQIVKELKEIRDTIISNIVLLGEKSAPTFKEKSRTKMLLERFAEFQVDECSTDGYQNPLGIIRGSSPEKPPIFLVAHLDTLVAKHDFFNFTVRKNTISGPGVDENSAGVGVLASIPAILKQLDLQFQSDIVLGGVIQSLGKGDLRGVRHLLKTWEGPIRGAICLEAVELGRFNYYSEGMSRGEIECSTVNLAPGDRPKTSNAILILNEIVNKILELRLPQKPFSKIIIGKIRGGYLHGKNANEASIGFEVRSDADDIVKELSTQIQDIVESLKRIYEVDITLKTIGHLHATRLRFNHPLIKATNAVMKKLNLEPKAESSESELSIFLSKDIPAITLGLTKLKGLVPEPSIEIEPLYTGITQVIGVMKAIDSGVCDGEKLA